MQTTTNDKIQTFFLPEIGFLRLNQIIGRPAVSEEEACQNQRDAETAKKLGKKPNSRPKRARQAIPALIPISASSWWEGVNKGRYPDPVRHNGVTLWKISSIRMLIKEIEREAALLEETQAVKGK